MTDEELKEVMLAGLELFMSHARMIAMLPLEDWLAAFEKAENVGAYTDPTLYRQYMQDPLRRGEILKAAIREAIPLKREILKAQKHIEAMTGKR